MNHCRQSEEDTAKPAELAIVGGGAAGLFAATCAARLGIPCVVLERKARLGSKILMTANGRCNFAKDISTETFLADLARGGAARECASFAAEAVRNLPPRQIAANLKRLGVKVKRMTDGRFFPADEKAATVVHAFGDALREAGVPVVTNCPVLSIVPGRSGHARFTLMTKNFSLAAQNVLVATGGASCPKTGSVGDGQRLARELGHKVVPLRAGLIGLETRESAVRRRANRHFDPALCRVTDRARRILFEYRGEIDCETYGLSGAAIYNAQRFVAHRLREGASPDDLFFDVSFDGEELRLPGSTRPRPLKEAIVTIGGVDTREVDPRTMQSRLVPGLFFAGEVLDIDGPTGGYNLTLAFATAAKAVASLARKTNRTTRPANHEANNH